MKQALVVVTVLVLLYQEAYGVQECYQCLGVCEDPLPTIQCEQSTDQCYSFSISKGLAVGKGCILGVNVVDYCELIGDDRTTCYICNDDLCNAASSD